MPDANDPLPAPPKRRLTVFYVILAIATAIVVAVVLTKGDDETPQPAIAGGYDVTGEASKCLGPQFDVQQSGKFVNLTNAKDDLGGRLTFDSPSLTGDVNCVEGGTQELDAKVADGVIAGKVGATPLEAELKRDPPDAGAQKPRAPASVGGPYKVSPRSSCLGSAASSSWRRRAGTGTS
jgi:hypothetical protein